MSTPLCCQRFASFHAHPERFFAQRASLDEAAAGRGRDGRAVTVTARTLFLTRGIAVQHSTEAIYDEAIGRFAVPRWEHDTYAGGLGLDGEFLRRLSASRGPILDVASGLSMFATEASALSIAVDAADLEFDDEHPSFAIAARHVASVYAEQMALLRCLAAHSGDPRYAMDSATFSTLDTLHEAREHIARSYPAASGRRFRADARHLSAVVPEAHYEVSLCGWLLVHLDDQDQQAVVASLIRVTRPGGEVHIRAGYGGNLAERLRVWMGAGDGTLRIGDRVARISPASRGDLAVLLV